MSGKASLVKCKATFSEISMNQMMLKFSMLPQYKPFFSFFLWKYHHTKYGMLQILSNIQSIIKLFLMDSYGGEHL